MLRSGGRASMGASTLARRELRQDRFRARESPDVLAACKLPGEGRQSISKVPPAHEATRAPSRHTSGKGSGTRSHPRFHRRKRPPGSRMHGTGMAAPRRSSRDRFRGADMRGPCATRATRDVKVSSSRLPGVSGVAPGVATANLSDWRAKSLSASVRARARSASGKLAAPCARRTASTSVTAKNAPRWQQKLHPARQRSGIRGMAASFRPRASKSAYTPSTPPAPLACRASSIERPAIRNCAGIARSTTRTSVPSEGSCLLRCTTTTRRHFDTGAPSRSPRPRTQHRSHVGAHARLGVALRPHVKTAKCAEVAGAPRCPGSTGRHHGLDIGRGRLLRGARIS